MKRKSFYFAVLAAAGLSALLAGSPGRNTGQGGPVTQGSLFMLDLKGQPRAFCPLKHTDVQADISGPLARVTVTQQFENPSPEKIEAIYTFPLPHNAAVDDMRMQIGDRTVIGKIKRREEARAIYEAARARGQLAGLLDQERPNIFTQSVANIPPHAKVNIVIRYVETMPYEGGTYEFVFPMVVAPRYIPRSVTDAGRISPPVTPEGTRAGHDISIKVTLDAGMPVESLECPTHAVDVARPATSQAAVQLKDLATIPNKDFILRYRVAGARIQDAVLAHTQGRDGYFTLILQPPDRVTDQQVTPRELVFVVDTSGSMHGFPIEKSKEVLKMALDSLRPADTFNIITFSGDEHILFDKPMPATRENLQRAWEFVASRDGRGGTEMMKAIRAALDPSDRQDHLRITCFMTDGEVGNDLEIIDEVRRHPNARVFAFGIGSSVNRFLLDNMTRFGRGEVEYVGLNDDGSAAARRLNERVHNPLLTDIRVDWNGLPISEVYPPQIPDLFSAKPVVISGRYTSAANGVIRLRGKMAGHEFTREIRINLPASEPRHDVVATLWARAKVADLMSQDLIGMQRGAPRNDIREAIVKLGLDYRLMTQYTSFVAVEETVVTEGGQPRRIEVPVEMPEGMSYEGVFGERREVAYKAAPASGFVGRTFESIAAPRQDRAMPPVEIAPPVRQDTNVPPSKLNPLLRGLAAGTDVSVEVWLTDTSPATIAKLKQLGAQILGQPQSAKLVFVKIRAEKLADLVKLAEVRYVTPMK